MTVQEILCLAASCLDDDGLRSSLEGGELTEEGKELLDCYNIIENEIATDYYPLKRSEAVKADGGIIPYSALTEPVIDILAVMGSGGSKLRFHCYPDHVAAEGGGDVTVLYTYSPERKQLKSESAFKGKVSARLMAFGVTSEYLIRKGRYETAKLWAVRYRDCLKAAGILRHPLSVRSRRWA